MNEKLNFFFSFFTWSFDWGDVRCAFVLLMWYFDYREIRDQRRVCDHHHGWMLLRYFCNAVLFLVEKGLTNHFDLILFYFYFKFFSIFMILIAVSSLMKCWLSYWRSKHNWPFSGCFINASIVSTGTDVRLILIENCYYSTTHSIWYHFGKHWQGLVHSMHKLHSLRQTNSTWLFIFAAEIVVITKSGLGAGVRKRKTGSAASAFVGGIATNKIITFCRRRKRYFTVSAFLDPW